MRILITGGCGLLGSHLVEHFLKNTDADIVVLDRLSYASSGFDRLRDVQIPVVHRDGRAALMGSALETNRVRVLGCDLSREIPEGVVQEIGAVDYIIHAAAETHVDNSIVDPLPFIQSNVFGTHHLLWYTRKLKGLRRVFLVSTDEVYGPASWESTGDTEDAKFRPANPYAAAKAGGEMLGIAYANTYKIPVTIVNTMNLIGERQGAEKYVPMVIRRVLEGEKVLIHADPSKTRSGTRFYIHCRNFASSLQWMIERDHMLGYTDESKLAPGDKMPLKLHVAGEREISNLDLALMIAKFIGKPLHYELVDFHSSRPGHDLRYALDASKIRAMGWQQPLNIEQSLEKVVHWYIANPRWLRIGTKEAA